MSETIHEQIGQWIASALDGATDPDETLTLRSVRPKVLDWQVTDFQHGDVVIEADTLKTESTTGTSRGEIAQWKLYGVIRDLASALAADTVVSRMIETVRRTLLAGNVAGQACGGLANNIDCLEAEFATFEGGLIAEVTARVVYRTAVLDGYTTPP